MRNIDLHNKDIVPSETEREECKVDGVCRKVRTWGDFKKYIEKNSEVLLVQIPIVEKRRNGIAIIALCGY